MPTATTILNQHVTLRYRSLDRLLLNMYVPQLQRPMQVVSFLRSPEQKLLNTRRTNSPAHTVAAGRSDAGFSLVYRSNAQGVPCLRKAVIYGTF